jgi:hypothetical protein
MLPLPFDAKTFAAKYGGVTATKYQATLTSRIAYFTSSKAK